MTPAQFERYKQQQEALSRTRSNATKHDGSEDGSDNEDDVEDETERNRQAAQLRQKQEAHLSVYRQQMTSALKNMYRTVTSFLWILYGWPVRMTRLATTRESDGGVGLG